MPVCSKCGFPNAQEDDNCINCGFPLEKDIPTEAELAEGALPEIRAKKWVILDWYEQHRKWERETPFKARASISPDTAEAAEPNTWTVTVEVGEPLGTGSHIALEMSLFWRIDLGRPFYPRHVKNVMLKEEGTSGYGTFVTVRSSNPGVAFDMAISRCSRLDIIDIAITEGELRTGDTIEIVLGDPDSSKLRCPKHAQKVVMAVGIDPEGKGSYQGIEEIPTIQVVGGRAASLKVTAPAVVEKGKPFNINVLPVDRHNENPASGYGGVVELSLSKGSSQGPSKKAFKGAITGETFSCLFAEEGVFYATAIDREHALIEKSNPIISTSSPKERIFFGDIHGQTYDSIGTGTLDEYFEWGRDVESLDFCATANHYGGRYEMTPQLWDRAVEASNRYYESGKFVTFVSYEWHGLGGHKNVYYRSAEGDFYPGWDQRYDTPEKLWGVLREKRALTIPHHSKYGGMTDWEHRDDEMQRLVEICSGWGISETGGAHSVQHALAMGYRLGFIGGTDTHIGQPAHGSFNVNEGKGLAAVYAEELTREAIWDALYNRHCYATTGDRIILDCRAEEYRMGEEISVKGGNGVKSKRVFSVWVVGTDDIKRVEIIRNNEVVYAQEGRSNTAKFDWEDEADLEAISIPPVFPTDCPFTYYYLRVTQRNREMAWSSPIWFNLSTA